ncbi:uncharacterized protein LOC120119832 [Hibiscus syriacus]|uniref:uncharacterized protein LOC120119832 n=1 Tax=Hibiscus syriacus TaxID=106335 RepID=UPI0019224DA3|nr:uncharacterized protein LOC120119832 [Hibiscus syriacus]
MSQSLKTLTPIALTLLLLLLPPLLATSSIHDLLHRQDLPVGLFPDNVKSYKFDDSDGRLEVHLESPCMVTANLSYGGLVGVEGLSQEELFVWFNVKGIRVKDPSSGLVLFDIGVAHKQLSLSLFEDPPVCKHQGNLGRKMGFQVQR